MTDLSENEQLVLFALSTLPTGNDRELSEKFGFKISTFTAIKNRLKRRGYFYTARMPGYHKIGYELFSTFFGYLKTPMAKNSNAEQPDFTKETDFTIGLGENFYVSFEFNQFLVSNVNRNFTKAYKSFEDLMLRFTMLDILDVKNTRSVYLPFEGMRRYNMFDSAPILYRHFELAGSEEWRENMSKDEIKGLLPEWEEIVPEDRFLTPMEGRVLYSMCRYPSLPDNKISQKMGVARQTVARIRKMMTKNGLMRTLIVPNFKLLNFDLIVFMYVKMKPTVSVEKQLDTVTPIFQDFPPYLLLNYKNELLMYSPFTSFGDYKIAVNELNSLYKEGQYIEKRPRIMEFSMENINIMREHAYYYNL